MLSSPAVARPLLPRSPVAAALAVLAAGCGFRSPASGIDGPLSPDGPPTDGVFDGPPAASCLERWHAGTVAFGAPTQIAELASSDTDRDPFLTSDELTIYFSSYRTPAQNGDVFTAERSSIGSAFGTPQRSLEISSTDTDSRFSMTSSELIAVVASDRDGTQGGNDIWLASRANKAAPFVAFLQTTGLPNINGPGGELDPELSADGLRLYLTAGSPRRVVMSERGSLSSTFGSLQQIPALYSGMDDADPSLSPDERIIVFTSHRGNGDADLLYATRADKDATFSAPARLDISSADHDGDAWISPSGCRLYFTSDRGGNFDLYVASMTPQ